MWKPHPAKNEMEGQAIKRNKFMLPGYCLNLIVCFSMLGITNQGATKSALRARRWCQCASAETGSQQWSWHIAPSKASARCMLLWPPMHCTRSENCQMPRQASIFSKWGLGNPWNHYQCETPCCLLSQLNSTWFDCENERQKGSKPSPKSLSV